MGKKWERPVILSVDELSVGLGICVGGETVFEENCVNGGQTNYTDTIPPIPHKCGNGGYASTDFGGCDVGSDVSTFGNFTNG
jgi:hypothetical protein